MKDDETPKTLDELLKKVEKTRESIKRLERKVLAHARRRGKRYKF